jgi:hypothetical protein
VYSSFKNPVGLIVAQWFAIVVVVGLFTGVPLSVG